MIIALTGGLGCGKSAVAGLLAADGWEVLDTDALAHELLQPGQAVAGNVLARFGAAVQDGQGGVDRRQLGALVFRDAAARRDLEGLTHPEILRRVALWAGARRRPGVRAAVVVPLLFEIGATAGWDAIVCVIAPAAAVRDRLRARGWTDEDIRLRLAAQWPPGDKARRSTRVIDNKGSLDDLAHEVRQAAKELTDLQQGE